MKIYIYKGLILSLHNSWLNDQLQQPVRTPKKGHNHAPHSLAIQSMKRNRRIDEERSENEVKPSQNPRIRTLLRTTAVEHRRPLTSPPLDSERWGESKASLPIDGDGRDQPVSQAGGREESLKRADQRRTKIDEARAVLFWREGKFKGCTDFGARDLNSRCRIYSNGH